MEAIHIKPTPLLETLKRISALQQAIDEDDITQLIQRSNESGDLSFLEVAQQRIEEAKNTIKNIHMRRAVREGSKKLLTEESAAVQCISMEEHAEFARIVADDVGARESYERARVIAEREQFFHFAVANEPEWRKAAEKKRELREKSERERHLAVIANMLLSLEDDARQDKHTWFDEERDWWTAMKFTEEDERQAAKRKMQRRMDDAAAAAAIFATSQQSGPRRSGNCTYQQPPQQQQQQYPSYGVPSSSYPQHGGSGYPQPQQPYGGAPAAYPQYGYAAATPPSYGGAPSGYPAYGATTPYGGNQGYYDPNRTNQGNNFGIAAHHGGPPPPAQPPRSNANQYTAPPSNIFFGRR